MQSTEHPADPVSSQTRMVPLWALPHSTSLAIWEAMSAQHLTPPKLRYTLRISLQNHFLHLHEHMCLITQPLYCSKYMLSERAGAQYASLAARLWPT